MDVWSKEQVEVRQFHRQDRNGRHELLISQHMRQMGNIKSNEKYNPNEVRHPPPTNMIDIERDSDLEKFIRST